MILALAAAASMAFAVPHENGEQPSLDQFGWELVYKVGGEFPAVQYIHPHSIRPYNNNPAQYQVVASAQWEDDNGNWRVAPNGLIIDCDRRAWKHDWGIEKILDQTIVFYVKDDFVSPEQDSPMGAVIKRVCPEK